MKLSMLEKWIGVPLCPCTQEPSHWFEWLHTIEHTALIGLFSKRSAPASSIFFRLKSSMTCGIGVCTGQPFSWHSARLHPKQRFASSTMWIAILCSSPLYKDGGRGPSPHPPNQTG